MKRKTSARLKIACSVLVVLMLNTVGFGCVSKEDIEEKAYNDVLEELKANGNPTGMFGATWYMTQPDVNAIFDDCYQFDNDILMHERVYCDRPAQVSYHFSDDRLMCIIVTFKEEFHSVEAFSDAYYQVQNQLSSDYGQMPEPIMHEAIPPTNGKWTDQDLLESERKMGRTALVHQIAIKDNSLGEQIVMYLSKKGS